MSDPDALKAIVPEESLPPIAENESYLIRYRIVSDDLSRTSHWSWVTPVVNGPGNVDILDGGSL
jgi:hypothetical protein